VRIGFDLGCNYQSRECKTAEHRYNFKSLHFVTSFVIHSVFMFLVHEIDRRTEFEALWLLSRLWFW
jgi:hypothetical protein